MMLNKKREFQSLFPTLCQPRNAESHKGTFGSLGIIGGAEGMSGAPILSGMAGLKLGAGRVYIGFAQASLPIPLYAPMPELMLSTADQLLSRTNIDAWIIGCGLGQSPLSLQILENLLHHHANPNVPIVFDADALSLIAQKNNPIRENHHSQATFILTPHPKEAAILLNSSVNAIQADRPLSAIAIAKKYNALVILKGHKTLIATPDTIIWENKTGNPALATAGTGDILAGLIGSLLAQKIPIQEAVCSAVWIHGYAADRLADKKIGPIGMIASELCDEVRLIRNELTSESIIPPK